MIAFYRMGTPVPGYRKEAGEYAKSVSEYITKNHGVEATCAIKIGGAAGRVGIRIGFDNMAAFEAWIEKARSDDAYMKLTKTAGGILADSEDAVWKLL